MRSINDGGPAFPFEEMNDDGTHYHSNPGMTLRDYFAAQALQVIYASGLGHQWTNAMISNEAYAMADAMLKAREEGGEA